MTSALQNILTGVKEMALAREAVEQQETPDDTETMSPEAMTEAINKLSAIVLDLSQKLDGGSK